MSFKVTDFATNRKVIYSVAKIFWTTLYDFRLWLIDYPIFNSYTVSKFQVFLYVFIWLIIYQIFANKVCASL